MKWISLQIQVRFDKMLVIYQNWTGIGVYKSMSKLFESNFFFFIEIYWIAETRSIDGLSSTKLIAQMDIFHCNFHKKSNLNRRFMFCNYFIVKIC